MEFLECSDKMKLILEELLVSKKSEIQVKEVLSLATCLTANLFQFLTI